MSDLQGDNYYRRLQLDEAASRENIVHAYRRLALGAHPDARPEDPDAAGRFREITEAYEVLADPERRAAYDRRARGARIQVAVADRAARVAGRAHTAGRPYEDGRPVVESRPPSVTPSGSLRVGPVEVGPARGTGEANAWRSPTTPPTSATDVFWRLVGQWWWP